MIVLIALTPLGRSLFTEPTQKLNQKEIRGFHKEQQKPVVVSIKVKAPAQDRDNELQTAEEFLQHHENYSVAWKQLALVHIKRGFFEEALELAEHAVNLEKMKPVDERDVSCYLALALAYDSLKMTDESNRVLQEILENLPTRGRNNGWTIGDLITEMKCLV
ncbi:MAG: tetratricopeptide repeat protein [Candidatus Melainabacteria bacterium]|nr:tetratricopeptide repeat protein [Candidatus Melainabacteria bacterium]